MNKLRSIASAMCVCGVVYADDHLSGAAKKMADAAPCNAMPGCPTAVVIPRRGRAIMSTLLSVAFLIKRLEQLCLILITLATFVFMPSRSSADTTTISANFGNGIYLYGTSTYNWSFNFGSLGLSAPGTVINSAVLTVSAISVDTNQDIPENFSMPTSSGINYYVPYGGPTGLSDRLAGEGNASTYLTRGDGATTLDLLPGLSNYDYLRDGKYD
jgi:hypothetical protein